MLYLQEDIAEPFLNMLFGAMDELVIGNPWSLETDIGPVINVTAQAAINAHIQTAAKESRVLKQLQTPPEGTFVSPAVIKVTGIADLKFEVFGPVMHVATFKADEIDDVIAAINETGFGLTFGMHSRIDDRVEQITSQLKAGNIYINRNQIGAIVGSQPFGGEGLSGTGPKAGGPNYVARFKRWNAQIATPLGAPSVDQKTAQALLDTVASRKTAKLGTIDLPGPTGESNRLSEYGRGVVLCLGPTAEQAVAQAKTAQENGCVPVVVAEGYRGDNGIAGLLDRNALADLSGFDLAALWSDASDLRTARVALAKRAGALIGLAAEQDLAARCRLERHVCIDTTASGGNASLLAAVSH